ncbi:MAG: PLP-dependent aminotransferase family protein [Propionibacteriaceae bacterium]|nr:PLP-dependent aminotransferase family protein [Propionibacteriaceae bacterium]
MRSLFAVANRPEVVSLAGGMPNIEDLPRAALGEAAAKLIADHGTQALQYGSGQGEAFIRELTCEIMALEGVNANPDDVVMCAGSTQGLDILTRVFIDPGDVILTEAPTYVGALSTFAAYQAQIVHVEMDGDGISMAALDQALATVRAQGKTAKFLYTIPNFQNPSGITQTMERRRELVEFAEKEHLLILEDNPYGLLTIDGTPKPALRSLESDQIIYLGSFSKIFSPGVRLGWIVAPPAVREKLVLTQEAATLCPSVFSQFLVKTYFDTFDWRSQIVEFNDMYRARRDAMEDGLAKHMPEGMTWTHPAGGFFVWAQLPQGLDSQAMLPRAVTAKVAYVPGPAFYADGFGSRYMRLSYCFPTPERIFEGTRRLGDVIKAELAMRATFGLDALEDGQTSPEQAPLTGKDQHGQGPAPDIL